MSITNKTCTELHNIRQERKKQSAEDFTPSWLVNQMLSKLTHYSPESFQDQNKTFLDPACGNGNILIQILKQKLANHHNPLQALSTLYGCDIMADNIKECKLRFLKVLKENNVTITIQHIQILYKNIVTTPLNIYPNGSLDYLDLDESLTFNKTITDNQAIQALNNILTKNLLDTVNIQDDINPLTKIKEVKQIKTKIPPVLIDQHLADAFDWDNL